jgi:hypothetical protein
LPANLILQISEKEGDFKMSNLEIATLDLRKKPGFLAGFSKSQFKITDFEIGSQGCFLIPFQTGTVQFFKFPRIRRAEDGQNITREPHDELSL